jgi:hypothetical protein
MDFYPSRKTKNKRLSIRNKRRFILITNLWMIYLIAIFTSFIPITNTFSYFNDSEIINNQMAAAEDFCKDKEYKEKYCKDNSGIGNGPEPNDEGETGDPDNPGNGNEDKKDCGVDGCVDDHPKDPKNKDTKQIEKEAEDIQPNGPVEQTEQAGPERTDNEGAEPESPSTEQEQNNETSIEPTTENSSQ